ncbi:uncharacterized protein LOC118750256 [Rhagoletis pomonella]|uniref:uncharacterized protein LOC118750256 n=1 Tax=Rhagoletis pomonella TaxID=28610 RepID=UPI0017864988|nr:uncharacterized protein LOC118750256 [Rhagoletis pomonella]
MDLTNSSRRNSHPNRLQPARSVSLDDDDIQSNNSSSSFNILLAAASDSESQSSPISVRDMIKRYDTVAKLSSKGGARTQAPPQKPQQLQHGLLATKSAYTGVNKFDTHTATQRRYPLRQYVAPMQENTGSKATQTHTHRSGMQNGDHNNNNNTKVKSNDKFSDNSSVAGNIDAALKYFCILPERHVSLSDLSENIYIADHSRRSSRSPDRNINDVSCSLQAITSDANNSPEATDGIEEANLQPIETSYQSKTTIAKTAGGVRIIIDIFFDQEHQPASATDVVGSRVETDLPHSRILNEFQQQAAAAQIARN